MHRRGPQSRGEMVAGDFIVQLDSDDLLEPTAIEKWPWHLDSHPEHAVKGFSVGFGAKNYLWNNGFHNREAFLKENMVDLTSIIRKKSTFAKTGGYDVEMRKGLRIKFEQPGQLWVVGRYGSRTSQPGTVAAKTNSDRFGRPGHASAYANRRRIAKIPGRWRIPSLSQSLAP